MVAPLPERLFELADDGGECLVPRPPSSRTRWAPSLLHGEA